MYKLVAVAGKLRGKEFELQNGEHILGRDDSCAIRVAIDGISKKHMSITVSGDAAFIEDLGSANGTFLNGEMIKRATVKPGDKIALPNVIFQVVYVEEHKIIIKKKVAANEAEEDLPDYVRPPDVPKRIPGKIIWFFKYKLMPMFHSANEEYEWRALLGMIMCGFVIITMSMTIFPIMRDANEILVHETKLRAIQFASTISRTNAQALKDKNLDRIDTTFLEREEGVASYELFDLEGRIFRPISKQNDYVSDSFSIRAREWAFKQENLGETPLAGSLDAGEIGVAQKIMSYDVKTGSYEGVGVIAIRFKPISLAVQASKNAKSYLDALATSAIVAVIFFGIIYYLSLRPLEEMRFQIEEALRGKRKNLESKHLMGELSNLRTSINSVLQRIRELQSKGESPEFEEMESDATYVETLQQFMVGAGVPVIILDSQKNIKKINVAAEDLCGIREVSSVDKNFLDVAREKGFAATVTELCDLSSGENGANKQGEYELAGQNYNIFVKALLGKDSFAKAFYITFVKQ